MQYVYYYTLLFVVKCNRFVWLSMSRAVLLYNTIMNGEVWFVYILIVVKGVLLVMGRDISVAYNCFPYLIFYHAYAETLSFQNGFLLLLLLLLFIIIIIIIIFIFFSVGFFLNSIHQI